MLRLLTLVVVFAALLNSALPAVAQDYPSITEMNGWMWCSYATPGHLASRGFRYSGTRDTGITHMRFQVFDLIFDQYAEFAVPFHVDVLLGLWNMKDYLVPTSAPRVRDSTLAYTGKIENEEGDVFDAAILTFRDGRYVHLWLAYGHAADPLTDLTTVADQLFTDPSASSATPDSASLLDRLPTLSDLPPGLVLDDEVDCNAAEPVGTPVG